MLALILLSNPPLPPKWAFLPWKWRDEYRSRDEVLEEARLLREHDIPCSAIIIDSPWETDFNTFEFDPERFPDPEGMVRKLHSMGFKVLVWITPLINATAPNFGYASEKGLLIRGEDGKPGLVRWTWGLGGVIDFTNPKALLYWRELLEKPLSKGVDGFKVDDGWAFPKGGRTLRGEGPMENCRIYVEETFRYTVERTGGRGTTLSLPFTGRPELTGMVWTGDEEPNFGPRGLKKAIERVLMASEGGYPFVGSDIGGYLGEPDRRCFIRWAQFGAFCPLMETGGKGRHEPWEFDDETLRIFRFYSKLHAKLLPYIYTYAVIAHREGRPMIRRIEGGRYEYLFGEEILVAPIYDGGESRCVRLPEGRWIDFFNGEAIEGPAEVRVAAPLDKIPLFVRSGAIVPMEEGGWLELLVIPDGRSSFRMLDKGMEVEIRCCEEGDRVKLEVGGTFPYKGVTVRARWKRPGRVEVEDEGGRREVGFRYEGGEIVVEYHGSGPFKLLISDRSPAGIREEVKPCTWGEVKDKRRGGDEG